MSEIILLSWIIINISNAENPQNRNKIQDRSKSTESINPYHATILIFYHSVNISSWKHSCLRKFLINSEHIMHVHAQTYCYVPFVFRGSRDVAFKKCTKLPKRTKEQECKRFGKLINKQIKNKTLPGLPYQPNTGEKMFSKEKHPPRMRLQHISFVDRTAGQQDSGPSQRSEDGCSPALLSY